MKTKVLNETAISFVDVKQVLDAIKAKNGELSFVAQKTYDYLEQFARLDKKKSDDLFKKLATLEVPRLKDLHMCKLIDVLPKDQKDIRTILQGYGMTITNENIKKIADTIAEYAS